MDTNYLDYPHRCQYCEYADELKNYKAGTRVFKCEKTGQIVEGNRIPECYACTFYEEVKK